MALQPVLYHRPDGLPAWSLFIKTKNNDGTVELVDVDGELKVGKCPVAEEPAIGHCTIALEAEASGEKSLEDMDRKELLDVVAKLNNEAGRTAKIELSGNAKKAEIIAAITEATKAAQ